MSMTCQLLAIPPEDAVRLQRRPSGVEALLAAPPPGADALAGVTALLEQLPAAERAQARVQLDAIRGLQGVVGTQKRTRSGPRPAERLDLATSWHGVHWLLCGADPRPGGGGDHRPRPGADHRGRP